MQFSLKYNVIQQMSLFASVVVLAILQPKFADAFFWSSGKEKIPEVAKDNLQRLALTSREGDVIEVGGYKGGIIRLRVKPNGAHNLFDAAEHSVVADGELSMSQTCNGKTKNPSCTVQYGGSTLTITDRGEHGVGFSFDSGKLKDSSEKTIASATGTMSISTENEDVVPMTQFHFPLADRLYGIPEHAVDLSLKTDHKYRLMNLDVFEYKLDDTGGIYGTIPFMMAHSYTHKSTVGVLVLNAADSSVETKTNSAMGGWDVTWKSVTGYHDVFFFPGRSAMEVHQQHAYVVGPTLMPPQFALGYHQCRWNYRSEADMLEVNDNFNSHNIPMDVLWLDIEHTDGKRYFTWDKHNFANPKKMIDRIAADGRQVVTITDPHIKRDDNYHVHSEATSKGFYVKDSSGNADYQGHCWPGTSSWIDFLNRDAREWYATLFKYDRYHGSTPNLYSWIDMNEPSVFNSHEVTMDVKAVHRNERGETYKHRQVHNVYGYMHTMAAYMGHILRSQDKEYHPEGETRPFILTRSFFSGSQR